MANYTKSFNFRNGVQVDDTNFIVNANGLVGIGTSIPREVLDVRGNTRIVGLLSATRIYTEDINVLRSGTNSLTVGIVSIASGIVTATSGVVTYYGDGGKLINLPTSQWIDVDSGFGYTSIYAAGNVGIATTYPNYTLQIGGNPSIHRGIGINSLGSIIATGIVTANKFVGIGSDLTFLHASNITSGTLNNSRLPSIISVAGSITSASGIYGDTLNIVGNITANDITGSGANITSISASNISSGTLNNSRLPSIISVAGSITSASEIYGSSFVGSGANITSINASNISSGTLNNSRLPSNINISGILTATRINGTTLSLSQDVNASGVVTASSFVGSGANITSIDASNISSGTLNNSRLPSSISISGSVTASSGFVGNLSGNVLGNLTGTASLASNLTGSPAIIVSSIYSEFSRLGVTTSSNLYVTNALGIGTLSTLADIHVYKSSSSAILLHSDTAESYITVGNSINRVENNGEIRFGNRSGIYPFSNNLSLDIVNYARGNVNTYLHSGTISGLGTGNFNWIYGQTNNVVMSLTYQGNLGIGITNPFHKLEVVGTSTITSDLYVGNDFNVSNNVTIGGDLQVIGNLSSNVTGTLLGNVNTNTGISTFNQVSLSELNVSNFVGIGTTTDGGTPLKINKNNDRKSFIVTTDGSIGIQTNKIQDNTILTAISGPSVFLAVGVGTTALRSSADFANAGGSGGINYNFMILPRVTTTERNNFIGVINGAIIYNTTTNKFQGYENGSWVNLI